VKAVTFDASIPKYVATLAAGALTTRWLTGRGRTTRFDPNAPVPDLPTPEWVYVRTRLGGVCGSDLALVRLKVSPSASPFSSSPFVIGHENVGEIEEAGSGVTGFAAGDRVVVNPLLPCEPRGVRPLCPHCAAGNYSRCENFTGGNLPVGMLLGTTRGLGGSWGEFFVAHRSQLHRVPQGLNDRAALLVEPLASVLSPVLAHTPAAGEKVLVIGAGSVGLLAVASLRAVAPEAEVTVLARHAFQAAEARRLGAAHVVATRGGEGGADGGDYFDELARISGGRLMKPILGKRVQVGGFDRSVVCVGTDAAVEDALRFTRSGGSIIMVGNVVKLAHVDWTPLWSKELSVHGSLCYNDHDFRGERRNAFAIALDLLAGELGPALEPLVTHTFALASYQEALALAFGKRRERSVKIALQP
jgi:threonine dehydrogenase-like Zn-dependent dehydrogenase